MKPFNLLTTRGKMRRYHQMARAILAHYPLSVHRIRCVTIRYNIIFRVDAVQGVFTLRISPDQHRTPLQVQSEMRWLETLCAESVVTVACPLRTTNAQQMVEFEYPGIPGKRNAVMMKWLYGTALRETISTGTLRRFGQAIAHLHNHSQTFLPDGEFMTFDDYGVDEWGDLDYLIEPHPLLTVPQQTLFRQQIDRCLSQMTDLRRNSPRLYLIHSDTNLNNALVYRGNVALFDFDDCRWGHFAQDLAPPLYWIMHRRDLLDAFLEGYTAQRPLPCNMDDLQMAIVHRALWGLTFMMHYRAHQPERIAASIPAVEQAIALRLK